MHLTNKLIALICLLLGFTHHLVFGQNVLTLVGGVGNDRLNAIHRLSDGTYLVGGSSANFSWLPSGVPVSILDTTGAYITGDWSDANFPLNKISDATGQVAYLLHISSDLKNVLGAYRWPDGTVAEVFKIKSTEVPGQPTGQIFISGKYMAPTGSPGKSSGYYIAKLNKNFLNGVPTGFKYVFKVESRNTSGGSRNRNQQPWDVGGDGKVVYHFDESFDFNWGSIYRLDTNGNREFVPGWPQKFVMLDGGTTYPALTGKVVEFHSYNGMLPDSVMADVGGGAYAKVKVSGWGQPYSSIMAKGIRFGGMRSTTLSDYDTLMNDENNNPGRKGKYPTDAFTPSPCIDASNCPTSGSGYTGINAQFFVNDVTDIFINRITNDMYINNNIAVRQPTGGSRRRAPAVICFNPDGTMRWWARLHREYANLSGYNVDVMATDLDFDYSSNQLVVGAFGPDIDSLNFFNGSSLANNPSAKAFMEQHEKGASNVSISWIGKYRASDGKILHATYVGEYATNFTGTGTPLTDPNLNGWPNPNSVSTPNYAETRLRDLTVDAKGNVYIAASGGRTLTTLTAHQQMPKPNATHITPVNEFVRVYSRGLDSVLYSSVVTGIWDTTNGSGGNNTVLTRVLPSENGILLVGRHTGAGNPLPYVGVPTWGTATASSESGILGHLRFSKSEILVTSAPTTVCQLAQQTIGVQLPTVQYVAGNKFKVIASRTEFFTDFITVGEVTGQSINTINFTLPDSATNGTWYVRVESSTPVTQSRPIALTVGNSVVFTTDPSVPSGNVAVCSPTSISNAYNSNRLTGSIRYSWAMVPANAGTVVKGVGLADTSISIMWNSNFEGQATLFVTAIANCEARTSSANIRVFKPLTAPFDLVQDVAPNVCQNISNFTISSTHKISALTYGFAVSPTNAASLTGVATSNQRTINVNNAYQGAFTLRGWVIGGCADTLYTRIDSSFAHRSSLPTVTVPSGPTNVCSTNDTIYSIPPVDGALSYTWVTEPPSVGIFTNIGDGSQSQIDWQPGFAGLVRIRVSAVGFCNTKQSGPLDVTLDTGAALTTAPLIKGQLPAYICRSLTDSSIFNFTKVMGANSYQSALNPASAGTISNTDSVVKVKWASNYVGNASVVLTAISGAGVCGRVSSLPAQVTLRGNPTEPVSASISDTDHCGTTTVPLTLMATGTDTLKWFSSGCGTVAIGSGSSLSITSPLVTTNYFVASTNGCGLSACKSVGFTVNPIPPMPTIIRKTGTDTLKAPSGYATYVWYKNSVIITGASDSVLAITDTGVYSVSVVTVAGCSAQSVGTYFVPIVTGINLGDNHNKIKVYPNPANEELVIETGTSLLTSLIILDLQGKQVYSDNVGNRTTVQVGRLPKGVYLVYLVNDQGVTIEKVVIEH